MKTVFGIQIRANTTCTEEDYDTNAAIMKDLLCDIFGDEHKLLEMTKCSSKIESCASEIEVTLESYVLVGRVITAIESASKVQLIKPKLNKFVRELAPWSLTLEKRMLPEDAMQPPSTAEDSDSAAQR